MLCDHQERGLEWLEQVVVRGGDEDAEPGHVAQATGESLGDAACGEAVEGGQELVEDERDGPLGADRRAQGMEERQREGHTGTLAGRERAEGLEEETPFGQAAEREFSDPLEHGGAGREVDDGASITLVCEHGRGDGAAAKEGAQERGLASAAGAGDEGK